MNLECKRGTPQSWMNYVASNLEMKLFKSDLDLSEDMKTSSSLMTETQAEQLSLAGVRKQRLSNKLKKMFFQIKFKEIGIRSPDLLRQSAKKAFLCLLNFNTFTLNRF